MESVLEKLTQIEDLLDALNIDAFDKNEIVDILDEIKEEVE